MHVHPLSALSELETTTARDVILTLHTDKVIFFREIYLQEPAKAELIPYLELEHSGNLSPTSPRPKRLAKCQYDVVGSDRVPEYHESIVDIEGKKRVEHVVVGKEHQASLTMDEFDIFIKTCQDSALFKEAIAKFKLPEGFDYVIEPWPYGGRDRVTDDRRYFQGLIFAQDKRSGNPDSNFYAYPIPIIPVMDFHKREIVRIEKLATGGKGDALTASEAGFREDVIGHCTTAEYVPELLPKGTRKDLKELNVLQPDGPSFKVSPDESLVEWQKWRFRVGFNPREGATIHDVWYDGRSVLYRLSMSEMTVPYADPRYPFHRKQAFDFGDGGAGNCANNLSLGCDCLGVIKYFDAVLTDSEGNVKPAPNVVCLHEQDNGIGWKHTNWRTGRAVVTRSRELVVQFIITLANYEYIFAYKFDLAGGISVESRATGIVSVVNIDPGKQSEYGNVVGNGVLAQNHQHVFCIRIDPAIEGHKNTVYVEESHAVEMNDVTNPEGNLYQIRKTPVERSTWFDAAPQHNRIIKMVNTDKLNPISRNPVGYKFTPMATQLLLADKRSIQAKRAQFAQHHVWVTKYRDGELFAGGRYTLQSKDEIAGVSDAVKRGESVANEDVVVWSVFGITHNPRVEDWPVMPVECFQLNIRPADFFTENPAIDVPSRKNMASQLVTSNCCSKPSL
ncbi:copper amine oxidase, putative [Talaromyces stipitatus ATCC 10500]|uniref:Amine oxidase n=1 Tax=Talaromyces stipitatus (strain ATCC 10500 / CBS 375.48 / QM 6759 / NRRL 1006) TaxID=441959 RepID=B8MCD1_TALSN|nr:copper amine oxidase, putative [Talaromyces stipitatus ATCC 10500]EED18577.1 copper amine oxidase, putative [Talaromyces stipitatus ATCC 10500]